MISYSKYWEQSDGKILGIVFIVACLMFLPALGSAGILNTTDAYYTEAAREMLDRRDFITPYLNYSPYYYKPILFYWLSIASYLTFGVSTFAARLPSALCAVATALVIFSLSRPFISRRASGMAALALLSMPLFLVVGHVSLTDMPLTLLITVSNLLLLRTLIRGESKGLVLAYVCLGLAMLCKGPLAVAFVGTCVGGFLLVTSQSVSDFTRRVLSLKPLLAIAIPLAVALPWFVAEHIASDGAFTRFFFIEQNFGRLSGQFQSHINPPWFYAIYLLGGFIPWLPLLLGAPVVFRRLGGKRCSTSPRVQIMIAACCWLFGTLALLQISSSKVAHYLLPLAPPIAILAGVFMETVLRLGRKRFILWVAPVMVIGGIVALVLIQKIFASAEDLRVIASVFVIFLILAYIVYGAFVYKSKMRTGVLLLYVLSLISPAVMVPLAIQQTYRRGNEGFEYLVKKTHQLNEPSIAVRANEAPTAAFYAQRKIFEINGPNDCTRFLTTTKSPHYFIFDSKNLALLKPFIPGSHRVVDTRGKWNLLLVEEVKAE